MFHFYLLIIVASTNRRQCYCNITNGTVQYIKNGTDTGFPIANVEFGICVSSIWFSVLSNDIPSLINKSFKKRILVLDLLLIVILMNLLLPPLKLS